MRLLEAMTLADQAAMALPAAARLERMALRRSVERSQALEAPGLPQVR